MKMEINWGAMVSLTFFMLCCCFVWLLYEDFTNNEPMFWKAAATTAILFVVNGYSFYKVGKETRESDKYM